MRVVSDLLREFIKRIIVCHASKNYYKYYRRIRSVTINDVNLSEVGFDSPSIPEREWMNYWRKFYAEVKPDSFRIFSRYMGKRLDIVPLEFIAAKVEPILTPTKLLPYYGDKNNFGRIIPRQYMPAVYLRNIGGYLFDEEYNALGQYSADSLLGNLPYAKVVVKPSKLDSGVGVQIFRKQGRFLVNREGEPLSLQYLNARYGVDWLVQEYISQNYFCRQFNPHSVNTVRIATYRDIKGEVHPLSAVFKIGAEGAEVDNAHSGGMCCGISPDGKLGKYVCDCMGRTAGRFNEVGFKDGDYEIPNWQHIQQFAVSMSKYVIHCDLVALDVAINEKGEPVLIEFNVGGFSGWMFQFCGESIFGKYTDEICERCNSAYSKMRYGILPTKDYIEASYFRK